MLGNFISRRIEVHDVNSTIFNHFLRFVYGGSVEANDFSIDTLSELLLLADRYEMDSLKVRKINDMILI